MAIKIRTHTKQNNVAYIVNGVPSTGAEGRYVQRYHNLLDAAYLHATKGEIELLYSCYDSLCEKERALATNVAIRILTRAINS